MKRRYYEKIIQLIFFLIYVPLMLSIGGILYSFYKTGAMPLWAGIGFFFALGVFLFLMLRQKRDRSQAVFGAETERLLEGRVEDINRRQVGCALEPIFQHEALIDAGYKETDKVRATLVQMERALEYSRQELEHNLYSLKGDVKCARDINAALLNMTEILIFRMDESGKILNANMAIAERMGSHFRGSNFEAYIVVKSLSAPGVLNTPIKPVSQWMQALKEATERAVVLNIRCGDGMGNEAEKSEKMSFETAVLSDGTYLCMGRAISDEIALKSNMLRRNRELEYIRQVNASLVSNLGVDILLENIVKRMDYLFSIHFGGIFMPDESGSWQLKAYASKQYTAQQVSDLKLESHIDRSRFSGQDPFITKPLENGSALLLSPLKTRKELLAVIAVVSETPMHANDLTILKMFKNQATMVIQRALIYEALRNQYLGTIEALISVIEGKDKYTEGHSRRVSRFAVEIAKEMGYSSEEVEKVEISGLLHDIGKIGIDEAILTKQGRLTEWEYEMIKTHPEKGVYILKAIDLDPDIHDAILYHHFRYDLTGYPESDLKALPRYAKIIGIADAFDAITSARPYSKAHFIDEAVNELKAHRGTQFDPECTDAFLNVITYSRGRIQAIIEDQGNAAGDFLRRENGISSSI